ncbi:MAG: hypothetical protein EBY56_00900 [Actinobacteria bacterium]|nr:hypothetical protein [Actinomycetota bacterium]
MFSVPIPARLVNERTDLSSADLEHLTAIVEDWSLLADLSLSDLILWLPTWNDAGALAVAHVRPTTAPTSTPEDVIGTFSPRGRLSALDQALTFGRSVTMRDAANPLVPTAVEAYPIHRPVRAARSTDSEGESGRDRDVIGVVVRRASSAPRVAGQLEEFYLSTADILFAMLISGQFPVPETVTGATGRPRIGDGVVRLDSSGTVAYASPNAVSALRRLGLATDVVGADFSGIVTRLLQRHGTVDAAIADLARGRVAGRLQSRRSSDEAISAALGDAQVRVAAIAVVHEALSSDSSNETDLGESVEFDRIVRALFSIVVEDPQSPLTLELSGEAGRLSAERATPLAMCVSELVHNAVQHAQGTFVTVEAVRAPDSLTIAVVDDGVGVDPDQLDAAGLGLNIVQSLATTELGGTFEFADQEYGTRAVVYVPLSGG